MAKMTLAGLQAFVATYVAAAKQAATWTESTDNLLKLIDKIGMQITLDGSFNDKLPELDGNDLPLGKTIEEWFIDLTLPQDFVDPSTPDYDGSKALGFYFPAVEDCAYSYTLGRKVIATSEPFNNFERAALTETDSANMAAKIMERLTNSYTLYTYAQKKQLLGNMATKAVTAGRVTNIAAPSDTETSEAYIKQIKTDVEAASFATEGTSLGGTLIGSAPDLHLYVRRGIMPTVEVDAMAGAFHAENLAIPATIKVVDDFGNADPKIHSMLVDTRGIKLHRSYHVVRDQMNGLGDFVNFFDHSENTGFISKNTFVKVYKSQA